MSLPGRKRVSLVLLLLLAAGLALAGAAAAAGAQDMACCPSEMGPGAGGCTWLGAVDCCSERPAAQAPAHVTPPASPTTVAWMPPAPTGTADGLLRHSLPARSLAPRAPVLRL